MTQNNEVPKETKQQDSLKAKEKREKNFQSKVVIRRLPPTMTEEQFLEQISPVPDNDYIHFVKADLSLGGHAYSRAYINILNVEDILLMKDKFDGYVFVDNKGMEYPAIVEFAPFQKIPKKRSKKKDTKCGTIEQDPDYIKFLETLKNPPEEVTTPETGLDLSEDPKGLNRTTPLIEYLKQRKLEKQKLRDEKREERKKRDLERKRLREEERRRRKSEKSQDTTTETTTNNNNNNNQQTAGEDEPVEVLKKPERGETEYSKAANTQSTGKSYKDREGQQSQHGGPSKDYGHRSYRDKGHTGSGMNRRDWERDRQREKVAAQRERERARKEENKVNSKGDKSPLERVKGFASSSTGKDNAKGNTSGGTKPAMGSVFAEDPAVVAAALETTTEVRQGHSKEPKKERQRIRNKDRPSMEIYRPGMRRLGSGTSGGSSRSSPQKEGSPSPCTSPPLNKSTSNKNSNSEEDKSES